MLQKYSQKHVAQITSNDKHWSMFDKWVDAGEGAAAAAVLAARKVCMEACQCFHAEATFSFSS